MAKRRVHEIAKAQGLSSKQVLAALEAAGIEAKAAASSVEEAEALKAIAAANGGGGDGASTAKGDGTAKAPQRKAEASASGGAAQRPARQRRGDGQSPTGPADGAGKGAGAGKKRRRVVIDSQASRRERMPDVPPRRPPRRRGGRRRRPLLEEPARGPAEPQEEVPTKIPSGATVKEVAETLQVSAAELIKKLMQHGEMATLTQTLTDETIGVLAEELDQKVEIVSAAEEVVEEPDFEDSEEELTARPPVVTIMGHVDHGKTSLLDAIRQTQVAEAEAGGITQHIGAYQVESDGHSVTFLDTPGHAAFTAMRARGANVTDLAVIVVAADDGLMPQTKEAIDHARAADVPVLIAVNKIDKPDAQPDRVRNELAAEGLTPEDWGGETVYCDVSAKTGEGLEKLLEMIILVAELEDLKANPNAGASGSVIESHLDPGRGPVVTVLVQRGTLRIGDALVAGATWGRVRAMHDYTGERVEEARPGDPVEVIGFNGVCEAGEQVRSVDNDREARRLASERDHRLKTELLARQQARRISLDEVFAKAQEGEVKGLNIVLKADVSGSVEALQDEIAKVPQRQVGVNVIHAATGGINGSDIMLAAASDAIVIGFNVRPLAEARRAADAEGVEIRTYSVIYKVTEDLRAAMEGMLEPEEVEERVGEAEVKETFRASRVGNIAGCLVTEGKVTRDGQVRLLREGTVIWTGRVGSLRRFKDNVQEVEEGMECGVVLDGYGDVKVGDVLELFRTKQVEQTLDQ